jgi:predicted ATPase
VLEQIDKDLTQKAIPNKLDETGKYVEYSSGLNSQIYFDVISSDRYKDGIYLIDQPEDDVSPKSIKGHLLRNFKDMGRNRQILMVTHNPQFVVNLDVDNVIIFTRENSHIKIESGALEYWDTETNVLGQVATLLDGGIETIRKRWKRYEKDN